MGGDGLESVLAGAHEHHRGVGARGGAGGVLEGTCVGRDVEGHGQPAHQGVQLTHEPVGCGVRRLRRLQPAQRTGLGGGQQAGAQPDHEPWQRHADPAPAWLAGWAATTAANKVSTLASEVFVVASRPWLIPVTTAGMAR